MNDNSREEYILRIEIIKKRRTDLEMPSNLDDMDIDTLKQVYDKAVRKIHQEGIDEHQKLMNYINGLLKLRFLRGSFAGDIYCQSGNWSQEMIVNLNNVYQDALLKESDELSKELITKIYQSQTQGDYVQIYRDYHDVLHSNEFFSVFASFERFITDQNPNMKDPEYQKLIMSICTLV